MLAVWNRAQNDLLLRAIIGVVYVVLSLNRFNLVKAAFRTPTIVFKFASVTDVRIGKDLSEVSSEENELLADSESLVGSDGMYAAQDVTHMERQRANPIVTFL